jgi:exodeoxyribonuclease V beta subunit
VRKLYVAVTRARALCVVPWGRINDVECGALFHLLQVAGRTESLVLGDAECATALAELRQRAPDAIGIVKWNDIAAADRWQAREPDAVASQPRPFTRAGIERDWTVWSFSRLVRGSHNAAADTLPGAGDGDDMPSDDGPSDSENLGGARFGSAMHEVFERTDFAAWRDANGVPAPQRALIERALVDQGIAKGTALPQAVDAAGAMLRDALNAMLPCGVRLADIAPDARRAEIEFHMALAPADSSRLFALLHQHGYQKERRSIAAEHLRGLLTGKIDVTFRHDARFWIVDWKTNRCPPYDAAALEAEIARHDYDLQWIIYTLALHRWLGMTLPGYDYDRDFGGVYYLFVRGMRHGEGVRADRPRRELIDALDEMFPAPRREAA